MLDLFLKRAKGSVTVMVTLLLVPTIFFVGFFDDMARVKLYGDQAVMVADNYGEAILTEYDGLLKELYGLFAITQDKEALEALDSIQEFMDSPFDPDENPIGYEYDTQTLVSGAFNHTYGSYDGALMPYKACNASVDKEFLKQSSLRDDAIFATQVGDFMKFRIITSLMDDKGNFTWEEVSKMLDSISGSAADNEVAAKKEALEKPLEKFLEETGEYYKRLYVYNEFGPYYENVVISYEEAINELDAFVVSDDYVDYKYVNDNPDVIAKIKEKEEAGEEELTADEERYLAIANDQYFYTNKIDKKLNEIQKNFENVAQYKRNGFVKNGLNAGYMEDFYNLLDDKAEDVVSAGGKVKVAIDELKTAINVNGVTPSIKKTEEENIRDVEALLNLEAYPGILEYTKDNVNINKNYKLQIQGMWESLNDNLNKFRGLPDPDSVDLEWATCIDSSLWIDFKMHEGDYLICSEDGKSNYMHGYDYRSLFEELGRFFTSSNEKIEKYKSKKNAANDFKDKHKVEDEKFENLRNVPSCANYQEKSNFSALWSELAQMSGSFATTGASSAANSLLLKFYTVEYNFGNFTSRITNNKKDEEDKKIEECSMAGYKYASNINYLYGAELEYVIVGSNTSSKNLNKTRDAILSFRTICNFASTYKIDEVNKAIKVIANACKAIPYVGPIVSIAVDLALRGAVAAGETALEWKELKEGKAVKVFKDSIDDLQVAQEIADILPIDTSKKTGKSPTGLKLDYEQYLLVMMLIFTPESQVFERTQNLVELNVNNVMNGGNGELSKMDFRLSNAYTAVSASCTVDSNFVVMPERFAQWVLSDSPGTMNALSKFEKNKYKYTVIRGY